MTLSQETRFSELPDVQLSLDIARVTAVLVIHDGATFLPRTLDAIEAQTRPPDVLIGVDAGSADDGLQLLRRATPHILQLGRDTSFGDAVKAALASIEGHALVPAPTPGGPEHPTPPGDDVAGSLAAMVPRIETVEWLWLLHDDSAPAPDALELLLDVVDRGPSIGIAGCKQVSWDDSRRLLDVGFTTSPLGARVTGVDVDDIDQGQLDHRSDVLAVATSGMLVRRDLWERLGGPDPALSHARADLDLCQRAHLAGQRVVVVPAAVMAHAAATATGRRTQASEVGWAVRDRRAAVHLRLAAAPWYAVPFLLVWLAGAALLRAAGRVALKQPERAGGELLAFALAVASPLAWWRARRRVRSGRLIRWRDLRRLQAGPRQVVRQRRDAVAAYLRAQEEAWAGTEPGSAPSAAQRPVAPGTVAAAGIAAAAHDAVAVNSEVALRAPREHTWDGDRDRATVDREALGTGDPGSGTSRTARGATGDTGGDDPAAAALTGGSLTSHRFLRPAFGPDGQLRVPGGRAQAVRLLVVITVATVAAGLAGLRLVLSGTGQILGPALLPMPATAGQLWRTALSGWRPAGLGLAAAGDPFAAVLALLSWPLGGSPATATVVLLAGAVPLSALAAWWAAGAVTGSRALRSWAAIAWAASPSLLLAIASGRLAPVVAHLVLPLAALALARGIAVARTESGRPSGGAITSSSAAGLMIAVLLAAAPSLTLPVLFVLLIALVGTRRRRRSLLWTILIPAVLLLPWWIAAWHRPRLLFSEAGGPTGTAAELAHASSWHPVLWPIDPARLGPGPVRSLAARVADLLQPVLPAVDAGAVLRGTAVVLCLPLVVLALSAVAMRPAAARWARASAAGACWLIALAAAAMAVALPAAEAGPGANSGTLTWPGPLVSLSTIAVLIAALCRLDGAAGRLRLRSAGWRHLGSVIVGGIAVLMPLLVLAGWVANGWSAQPDSWVHRGPADAVPAVAAAEADGPAATRSLVLQVGRDGVRWTVYRSGGPRTGDWSAAAPLTTVARSGAADTPLLALIGGLLSGTGADQRPALAAADIGSIVLVTDSDASAAQSLDTAIGLARVASTGQGLLWRVELDDAGGPTRPARARILSGGGAVEATLSSDGNDVSQHIGVSPQPGTARMLVLAERANPGWKAWLDGRSLAPGVRDGWAQSFVLPSAAGHLRVAYQPAGTTSMDGARLIIAGIALLGAVPLPIRRRRFLPPPARVTIARQARAEREQQDLPGTRPLTGRRARRVEQGFETAAPVRLDARAPDAIVTRSVWTEPDEPVPFFPAVAEDIRTVRPEAGTRSDPRERSDLRERPDASVVPPETAGPDVTAPEPSGQPERVVTAPEQAEQSELVVTESQLEPSEPVGAGHEPAEHVVTEPESVEWAEPVVTASEPAQQAEPVGAGTDIAEQGEPGPDAAGTDDGAPEPAGIVAGREQPADPAAALIEQEPAEPVDPAEAVPHPADPPGAHATPAPTGWPSPVPPTPAPADDGDPR